MAELKPRDMPHNTDSVVVTCMDHRFQKEMRQKLGDEFGVDIESSDRLSKAGSSKAVADGLLIPDIQLADKFHGVSRVYLIDHTDCGGFGFLAAYDNDEQKEVAAHFESIARAREAVHNVLPKLVVIGFVVTLDGEVLQPPTD